MIALPLAAIERNPLNPRETFDAASIAELAATMAGEVGLIEPIVVYEIAPDRYCLLAGERRLRAARKLGWETIPALVRPAPDEALAEEIMLVENLQRAGLNPIEEAKGYRRLYERGRTQGEIGKKVGKTQGAVANSIRLLSLPPEVQGMIADGRLSAAHGRELLAWVDSPERCRELAETAADPTSRLKVAHLAQMARSAGRVRQRAAAGAKGGESEGAPRCALHAPRSDGSNVEPGAWSVERPPLDIPRPTREEYEERRAREMAEVAARRSERAAHVAEWDQALSLLLSRVDPMGDRLGAAIVAAEILAGIRQVVLRQVCETRGLDHLPPFLDWTGEDVRRRAWDALAALSVGEQLALCRDALLSEELSVHEEVAGGLSMVTWYAGEAVG